MAMARKIYLEDIPLDEAWQCWLSALQTAGCWSALPEEEVAVDQALGRVTARPIWAVLSSPGYHASAMDGYAVRAADSVGATETTPIRLAVKEQAQPVNTGDALPAWANAVIMIEHVQEHTPPDSSAPTEIEIRASVAPWSNVRSMGEDMVSTELVLPANHTLRAVDLGAAAGCGHAQLWVCRRPRVAIIPTGTELISVERAADCQAGPLKPGDIIEYNSIVLAAQVQQWGGQATRWPIVPDVYDALKAAILEAARDHDLVLVNAGSSAGSKDFTARVVEEVGHLLVHGVAVRPGHPVILGMVDRVSESVNEQTSAEAISSVRRHTSKMTPVIGVPGYPVSCALTGEIFVEPMLAKWSGRAPAYKPSVQATITRKLLSPMGDDEWVRVTVGQVGERTIAAPLSRGAGVITSLVRADGIVRIPRYQQGIDAGSPVTVELYTSPTVLAQTIVHIGSHDLVLDLLAQHLAEAYPGLRMTSAHAGSLGGLIALQRGEAHMAGCHLIDPDSGDYNFSYVRQYVPDLPVVLVTLIHRQQGLLVAKGNPKQITGLRDLARPDVRFVNRQRGAGTRVLLDYRLSQLGLTASQVQGYTREEYTHLAVAAAVQSNIADCGLGIAAAAHAMALDFVPLEQERYDLVIPRMFYDSQHIQAVLHIIRNPAFQQAIMNLPGYDTSASGAVLNV